MTERERTLARRRRPQPPKEDGVVTVGKALAPQLGADMKFLIQQASDHRITGVLNELTQAALAHFDHRARTDGVRYYESMVEWELCSTPSINGLGRRQIIQAIAAAAGVGSGLEIAERPGWVGRHFTNRRWRETAEREGKIVEE